MRSRRSDDFWRTFRHHEGLEHTSYEATRFHTPSNIADRLIAMILAGSKRSVCQAAQFFGEGRGERIPAIGDYAVLHDPKDYPILIWRTTGVDVAPLSSVTNEFIWWSGFGTGDRGDWIRRVEENFRWQESLHDVQVRDHIDAMFEILEVVWPIEVARRIQVLSSDSRSRYFPVASDPATK